MLLTLLLVIRSAGKINDGLSANVNDNLNDSNEISGLIVKDIVSDNLEFTIYTTDTMLVLTRSRAILKNDINNMISKIAVIKEPRLIDISKVSKALAIFKLDQMIIYYINNEVEYGLIYKYNINLGCKIDYIELNSDSFIKFINNPKLNFLDNNYHSIYIVKDGNYTYVKKLFESINGCFVHISRWSKRTKM